MRGAILLLAAAFAAGPAAAAELRTRDGRICHDVVVVGQVKDYGEFVSYHDLDPTPDPDAIYIGGRQQMTVRIDSVPDGQSLPRTIQVRALMGSAYRLPVTMVFYLQRKDRGSWWAAGWGRVQPDSRGRVETPKDPPPRCRPRTAPAGS